MTQTCHRCGRTLARAADRVAVVVNRDPVRAEPADLRFVPWCRSCAEAAGMMDAACTPAIIWPNGLGYNRHGREHAIVLLPDTEAGYRIS